MSGAQPVQHAGDQRPPLQLFEPSGVAARGEDAHLVQQMRRDVDALLAEIAELARSDRSTAEFQREFLTRVSTALAADSGAVWSAEGGSLRDAIRFGEAPAPIAEEYEKILPFAATTEEPFAVAPRSRGGDTNGSPANPSDRLLLFAPVRVDGETAAIVEIIRSPGTGPTSQRGFLRFLAHACSLAEGYYRRRRFAVLKSQQANWSNIEQFIAAAHESLDLKRTLFSLCNEGRKTAACDRVAIALVEGRTCKAVCVSGLDSINRRADEVRRLERLSAAVAATKAPLWHEPAAGGELAPQVEQPLNEYLDIRHSRSIGVVPLSCEGQRGGLPFAVVIFERMESADAESTLRESASPVVTHAAPALANAIAHDRVVFCAAGESIVGRDLAV